MSNTYPLHQTINELLPQLNQKYGLKIEIYSDYFLLPFDSEPRIDGGGDKMEKEIPAIQAPQIRQILFGLREVLGSNSNKTLQDEDYCGYCGRDMITPEPYSESGNLDDKWFRPINKKGDYCKSLIDREPDTVLQELIEIIKELLK
jgi:hypothetical protein